MPDAQSCEHWLKVIANFVAPWPGRKIGAFNHISIMNEGGSKPPLLWVFNSANEFPALAEALGPDQPLVGMRSLNGVVRRDTLTTRHSRLLATSYSIAIASYLGNRPCSLGGNCQGAPIAAEMARNLILDAMDVRGFIAMEWMELPPLPLRATLLFGAESKDYNPFLRNFDPWPAWNRLFTHADCRILPGTHGTYFLPKTIVALANEIRNAVSMPEDLPVSHRPVFLPKNIPDSVSAGRQFTVSIETGKLQAGDDILAIWECESTVLPHLEVVPISEASAGGQILDLSAPAIAGSWTLQLFQTNPQQGPLTWRTDTLRDYGISVVEQPDALIQRQLQKS
ncbi:alpha/beta fold hydrolase [Pseudotabrizicola alkalilacus]|nr:hypothetical protein [Pseudotabrizicola alkalilacus]